MKQSIQDESQVRNQKPAERNHIDQYQWINLVTDDLSPLRQIERHAAHVLADVRNAKTGRCDPGFRRIARMMGCTYNTARNAVQGLESKGFIEIERRRMRSWSYTFKDPSVTHLVSQGDSPSESETRSNHEVRTGNWTALAPPRVNAGGPAQHNGGGGAYPHDR